MKAYELSNAVQDNLWLYLTTRAHADGTLDKSLTVKQIMDTWTLQMGYPVVHVERSKQSKDKLVLNQQWFLLNPLSKFREPNNPVYASYKWFVPFTYTTRKEGLFVFESNVTWLKPTDIDR